MKLLADSCVGESWEQRAPWSRQVRGCALRGGVNGFGIGETKRDALGQVKVALWHSGLDFACAILGIEADLKKP